MRAWRCILLALALVVPAGTVAADQPPAAEAEAKVSYYSQIRPLFQAHCQGCHQPAKPGGAYVMTSFDHLLKGGESEVAAIVPGNAGESNLIDLITPEDDKAAMPKGKKPLTPAEIELVTRWIAEGAVDDTPAGARLRYSADNPPLYRAPPIVTALDYSSDGQYLAVSGFHEVLLHKADGSGLAARLVGLSERIQSVRFSPDGKLLAVIGGLPARMGEVQVWNVAERKLVLSRPATYDTLYGGAWSPDGKSIAFGCSDNTVRVIDAATGEQTLFSGAHNDWVLDAAFSVDGSHLVSVSRDQTMKLIEVKTQRFIDNITSITPGALKGGILAVDRHPSKDELLVGAADGVPKTYLMHRTQKRVIGDDYQKIRAFEAMPGRVFASRYLPDGERIVAGGSYNGRGEVRAYQAADGKLLWKFEGESVYAVACSPDGKTVAAGGFDGVVRFLDASTGAVTKELIPVEISPAEVAAAASE